VQIKDSVAVVTGGASGLGLATTKRLLDAGAQVVVLDIRGKEAVGELGDRAVFAETDVTDEAAVIAALDIADGLGPVRIVVNCAGTGNAIKTLGKDGPFPLDLFKKVVEINLIGTFNVIRLGAERIARTEPVGPETSQERGVIVNTASVAAFDGQIGQAAYSASKGGVVGMTLPVARDLSAVGIRVNTVAPGLIDTPIYGEGEGSEAFKANLEKGVLFPKRLGSAEELASMVIELLGNSYMNAETIRVDGGIRMPPK
jgi:NAD(P)-dependent dehydrogenase (short-subunit alcohol dehydrogenase family)